VETPEDEPLIVCRQCRQSIARPSDGIAVNGAHRHVFANPHGLVFEIGCFRAATGCGVVGPASDEFTWFAGYLWQTLLCTGCLSHLGWSFSAGSGDLFFGLIPDQLIFPP
jgi:hypothetical protein